MSHLTFILTILTIVPVSQSSPIDSVRRETIALAGQLWNTERNISEALSAIKQLTSKLDRQPFHDIDDRQRVFKQWSTVLRRTEILQSYESFLLILSFRNSRNTTDREWLEFVDNIFGALPSMDSIHRDVIADDTVYGEVIKEHVDNICEQRQSTQQLLYTIYAAIQEAYLKIYVMANSAWLLLRSMQNQTSLHSKAENMTRQLERISLAEAVIVNRYINTTSRSFWRCDPKEHQDDVTSASIKGLLQGYIVNEVDLSPGGSCQNGCNHYTTSILPNCKGHRCFNQKQCNGRLFNCAFFYPDMRVCMSPADSYRRYEYIQFNNGSTFGQIRNRHCETKRLDSWWRVVPPSHCTYCFCQCEDHERDSERYFSLGSAVSDVAQNKIVTGIRFFKIDRTFYIQIQEGTLLPHGYIDPTSLQWVPVNKTAPKFLMSYENRKIDLDDLHASTGYALTGMRFREIDGRLNPQIMTTPFEYTTGILLKDEMQTYWHGNSRSEYSFPEPRRELVLQHTDVYPTNRTSPDSSPNTYVTFGPSSYGYDAAQTTVPLLDIQPVCPKIPTILSGAGIFHRGEPNSAGFVGLKIFTYDLSGHIEG